jgi:hypothetical protein
LSNLQTLCIRCHGREHRGREGATGTGLSHPATSLSRETPQPRPRFSRNTLRNVSDDEGPLIG